MTGGGFSTSDTSQVLLPLREKNPGKERREMKARTKNSEDRGRIQNIAISEASPVERKNIFQEG